MQYYGRSKHPGIPLVYIGVAQPPSVYGRCLGVVVGWWVVGGCQPCKIVTSDRQSTLPCNPWSWGARKSLTLTWVASARKPKARCNLWLVDFARNPPQRRLAKNA